MLHRDLATDAQRPQSSGQTDTNGGVSSQETFAARNQEAEILLMNILAEKASLGALHDSVDDEFAQPTCHLETRCKILDDLYKWAMGDANEFPLRWLHGPAGAGKSAIMRSTCRRLLGDGSNCLGASFFFKRGDPE
ncbi:hypothetical protein C8F01DRAFT_1321462 [Mycena amicta]|nr:hypothetical protein C8F01DRAFT_1321462 [Mycena amicta]